MEHGDHEQKAFSYREECPVKFVHPKCNVTQDGSCGPLNGSTTCQISEPFCNALGICYVTKSKNKYAQTDYNYRRECEDKLVKERCNVSKDSKCGPSNAYTSCPSIAPFCSKSGTCGKTKPSEENALADYNYRKECFYWW